MENLKKISGDLLLYIYELHRKNPIINQRFSFRNDFKEGLMLDGNSEFCKTGLKIAKDHAGDFYASLKYLKEKGFVSFKEKSMNVGLLCFNFKLTASGVDIVEGIDRSEEDRGRFNVNFNIEIAKGMTVESFIKAELNPFKGLLGIG